MRSKRTRILVLGVAFAMLLAACGGDADETTTTAAAGGTDTTAAATTTTGAESTATSAAPGGEPVRVAVVYDGTIDQQGWNGAMYEGQLYLEEQMPNAEVISVEGISPGQAAQRAIGDLAEDGYDLIVGTSTFDADMAIVAPDYPDSVLLSACDATLLDNMGQFCSAVEEARYIDGALAAMLSETGEIGYVAAFAIDFVLKPLNMFVAGARSVNPDANVHVVFTNSWFDPGLELQGTNALVDIGVDVLTYDLSSATVPEVASQNGLSFVGYGYADAAAQAPESWRGGSLYNWGPAFVSTAEKIAAGTWESEYIYGGYADGLLSYTELPSDVPADVQDAISSLIADIESGTVDVFSGPITDRDGNVIVGEGEALDPFERPVCCSWVIDGVVGEVG